MKKLLFIVSHLGSGSLDFIDLINENSRIDIKDRRLSYDHPNTLDYLFSTEHKLNNSAAIYGDHVVFNKDFSNRVFYSFSKFVYIIRAPQEFIGSICEDVADSNRISRYYEFRLRRMYEMARNTEGAVFFTWNNLKEGQGLDLFNEYMQLQKEPVIYQDRFKEIKHEFPADLIESCQDTYEKYLFKFKNLNLRSVKN